MPKSCLELNEHANLPLEQLMNSGILPNQITHSPLTVTHYYFHKERNYGKLSSKLNTTLYSNTNSALVYQHMH